MDHWCIVIRERDVARVIGPFLTHVDAKAFVRKYEFHWSSYHIVAYHRKETYDADKERDASKERGGR